MDWQPLVAAMATFIALQGPAVANLLFTIANRKKIEQVHQNTNGSLDALRVEVARLSEASAALQAKIDELLHAPGPI